ncbi:MAG: regulatory protein RecX [Methylobacter sp.]|nr:regulatory protein RecX [Methylobacter sp.]
MRENSGHNEFAMDESAKEIRVTCLHLLARREHSRKELLDKLVIKGFNKDEAFAVIDELVLQGWQNDQRYAESYARYRIQKGYGPIRIAYELRQKGIDAATLEEIMRKAAGNWMDLLEQVYTRKYKHDILIDRSEWAKRSRFLLHRGFSTEMISALFDHLNIKF